MQGMSITSQRAQIQIRTQRAQLNIQSSRPRMSVRSRRAKMVVDAKGPQFRINRQSSQIDGALRSAVTKRGAGKIAKGLSGGASSSVASSSASAHGDNRGTADVAQMVREQNQRSIADGIDTVADSAPSANAAANKAQIEWEMGYRNVSWEPHETQIDWEFDRPKITFNPHSIEIKLSRYPMVKITFSPEYFEMQHKRRRVDKKI